MRSNVELITASIERIDQAGIISEGRRREVDVIVCATGFDVEHALASINILGLDGSSLNQAWANNPQAYRGVTVANFPNFFLLLGPNTGQGHTSAILFIEAQVNYAMQCIKEISSRGKSFLEVKPAAAAQYNEELLQVLKTSVWAAGCRSWYKTESGKIIGIYPGFSFQYMRELRKPRFEDYIVR
jgi:cation diffusion facilitator CzcD-associated flavoprotein CzcO